LKIDELFLEARAGNSMAEAELFNKLSVRFRTFVSLYVYEDTDVDEIVQEAMLKIINKYKTIEIKKSYAAWAYSYVKYEIREFFRKGKKNKEFTGQFPENISKSSDLIFNSKLKIDLLECLKEIFKKNKKYARILVLKYQGYSLESITERLKITPGNLYVIVSRARSLLKSCLKRKGDL
jgi:RNA polymerase sigma-70 factor (ECF subfamily)